jgi:hypothetical protein
MNTSLRQLEADKTALCRHTHICTTTDFREASTPALTPAQPRGIPVGQNSNRLGYSPAISVSLLITICTILHTYFLIYSLIRLSPTLYNLSYTAFKVPPPRSIPPHVPYRLRGLPSRLWPKCNRLLRLGRPWGAVTLSRWGGWWYMNMKYQEGP